MAKGSKTQRGGQEAGGYTVLARRYRSRDFDEVVGQEPTARTLRNAIAANRTAHAYLFCGTRGVGKTSMARIFAKALNVTDELTEAEAIANAILRGDDLDVVEIDGASNRGIQEAKDLIAGAGLSPARCRYKIYIIDEVHMLTTPAFNALLKTMEEPPAHVKFILCTTEAHKVPATIQSRCQRFDFRAIPTPLIAGHLRKILQQEGIGADDAVVFQVARLGNGSMRDALSLLDRLLSAGEEELTPELLEQMLGLPDHALVSSIVDAIAAGDARTTLEAGSKLIAGGATVDQALEMLTEHLRILMVIAACGTDAELLDLSTEACEAAATQAEHFDAAGLVYLIALCDAVGRNARGSATARAMFDSVLVRMAMAEHLADIPALLEGGRAPVSAPMGAAKKKELNVEPARPLPAPPSPTPRPAAPPPPTLTETKPAATVEELPDEELWPRVVTIAATSPADQSVVSNLRFGAVEGDTLRLSIAAEGADLEPFLRTQTASVAELVRRATGRRMRVVLDSSEIETGPGRKVDDRKLEEVRQISAVRKAMDLFDASVIDVQPAGEPSTHQTPSRDGDPEAEVNNHV